MPRFRKENDPELVPKLAVHSRYHAHLCVINLGDKEDEQYEER